MAIETAASTALITNDIVVFGLISATLGGIFYLASGPTPFWKKFFAWVPALLLCYFVPAIYNTAGLIDGEGSQLYYFASRVLLPAALVLLTLSIDLKGVLKLGPRLLFVFVAGTFGVVLGAIVSFQLMAWIWPEAVAGDTWKGMAALAGSWIGGGANQTAMKEIFNVSDNLFASMIVVDVVVANIWMGFLLYGANISERVDRWLKADSSAITDLKKRVENYQASVRKMPTTTTTFIILAVGFGGVAASHVGADIVTPALEAHSDRLNQLGLNSLTSGFFWLIVFATTIGLVLSATKARKLEGVGASRFGSVFIYVLVATIGMKMNLGEVFENLGLFAVGIIWMLVHVSLLLLVGKLIKAPFFFVAVGSQANVGGAASAPIVASAFSPALAPVGVLMAVLGYALGTYGALICAWMMQAVAGG